MFYSVVFLCKYFKVVKIWQPFLGIHFIQYYNDWHSHFQTTIPQFRRPEMGVYRRFSDFLGLHEKLNEKYMTQGRIVPPAPEKSVLGMKYTHVVSLQA